MKKIKKQNKKKHSLHLSATGLISLIQLFAANLIISSGIIFL